MPPTHHEVSTVIDDYVFRIILHTDNEGPVYEARFPAPAPVPRVGDDVRVPAGKTTQGGLWRVRSVTWEMPITSASLWVRTMRIYVCVEWSPLNRRPAPEFRPDAPEERGRGHVGRWFPAEPSRAREWNCLGHGLTVGANKCCREAKPW